MELNESMYVRTKYGITQYKKYETTMGKLLCIPVKDGSNGIFADVEDIIGEPSYDLLDLLEVGDVIAIKEDIDKFSQVFILGIYEQELLKEIKSKLESGKLILDGILTKEQFEREAYKLWK